MMVNHGSLLSRMSCHNNFAREKSQEMERNGKKDKEQNSARKFEITEMLSRYACLKGKTAFNDNEK